MLLRPGKGINNTQICFTFIDESILPRVWTWDCKTGLMKTVSFEFLRQNKSKNDSNPAEHLPKEEYRIQKK